MKDQTPNTEVFLGNSIGASARVAIGGTGYRASGNLMWTPMKYASTGKFPGKFAWQKDEFELQKVQSVGQDLKLPLPGTGKIEGMYSWIESYRKDEDSRDIVSQGGKFQLNASSIFKIMPYGLRSGGLKFQIDPFRNNVDVITYPISLNTRIPFKIFPLKFEFTGNARPVLKIRIPVGKLIGSGENTPDSTPLLTAVRQTWDKAMISVGNMIVPEK